MIIYVFIQLISVQIVLHDLWPLAFLASETLEKVKPKS
jgi:hypothetical protein